MKKLMYIVLAIFALQVNAQDDDRKRGNELRKERKQSLQTMSAEEMATLQTKKMTLQLDLTEAQQEEIMSLNLEAAKERNAMMEERKATREKMKDQTEAKREELQKERFKMKNERLDKQIELKAKMKDILSEEQYSKWEASVEKRGDKSKGRRVGRKGARDRKRN